MLQTNPSASSIQRRRLLHRRQQSLETPVLAPPLPGNPRRSNSTRLRTGRGHSIDLGAIAGDSPSALQPTPSQDSNQLTTGPTPARTKEQDTPLTPTPDQQHSIKQETQEHSLAQPGFQPSTASTNTMNFQSHLQQQLNGAVKSSATAMNPEQAAAMQSLQSHLLWYEQKFGLGSVNVNPQASCNPADYALASEVKTPTYIAQPQLTPASCPTAPAREASQTVPNTPQQQQGWPSPPPSHLKHSRSQSYQLDVAPMPSVHDSITFPSASKVYQTPPFKCTDIVEHDYAASIYSSSNTDGSSPPHQHSTPLPTLFEEASLAAGGHEALFQATAGAADPDFNDPNFAVGGLTPCPEQAALDAAGIDATYIDTGISEEVLNSWLVAPTGKNEPYICKFKGCSARVNRKENARSHVQNHLDDRRFQCNPCGKRFSRMHDTKRHFLTHTQERPAVCPCGKTFARADALTRHRQRDMCAGVLPGFEKTEEDRPKRGRPKKDRSQDDAEAGDKTRKRNGRPDMETRTRRAHLARTMDRVNAALEHFAASSTSGASERSMPDTPPHDHDAMDATDFLNLDGANDQFNSATSTWLDTPPTSPPSSSPIKASTSKVYIDLSAGDTFDAISPSKLSTHSSPSVTAGATLPSFHDSPSPVVDPTEALLNEYSSPSVFEATTGFHGESSPIEANAADVFDFNILDAHPNVAHEAFSPAGASESGSSSYHSDFDVTQVGDKTKHTNNVAPSAALNTGRMTSNTFEPVDDDIFMTNGPQYGDICDMLDAWISAN